MGKQLQLTLIRSANRRTKNHKACLKGLGLRRIGNSVKVPADPCHLGMVNKVAYLLHIEEIS